MTVRGWCPGVHEPMPAGDGLLVRVKPPGGRLPPDALRAVADAAEAYGNGIIELTSRGNLQLRGLTEATAPRFAAAMVAAGLVDPDPARERRRNVIVMPPYDDALAAEVEAVLVSTEGMAAKFCVAIGPAEADVVITRSDGRLVMTAGPECCAYTPDGLRQIIAGAAGRRLPRGGVPATSSGQHLMVLPFGQTDPAALRRLADRPGVRTTPFRAFYVPGVIGSPHAEAAALLA